MLQFHSGGWEHRAYWGDDLIPFGVNATASRHSLGSLPKSGQWVRLDVPAVFIGFDQPTDVDGMSFDQAGGKVFWDKAGMIQSAPPDSNHSQVGDVLWALFASPEFQYIR